MKLKKILLIILCVIIFLVLMAVIYFRLPFSPEKKKFDDKLQEKAKQVESSKEVCTAEEIERLPKSVQRYCQYIGLENFPKYKVANTFFKKTNFVFDTKSGKVITMDYDLWLFYDEFYRTAFCSSSIYGIPFEGVDYATEDKQGGMKGILAKHLQIFDECDTQGYKAGLISWLAESATINPSALLSPHVKYEEIDDTHVKVTVTYNGISGSGIFTIKENGELTEFYSDERQVEEIDGEKIKMGWKCYYENYEERDGLYVSSKVKSIKIFPSGKELVYFESDHFDVKYVK